MTFKARLYDILGLSAFIGSFITSILTMIMYIVGYGREYLVYSVAWLVIGVINYLVWRSKPAMSKSGNQWSKCGELRESAELLAILNSLYYHKDEYMVGARLSSLLNKRDILLEAILSTCGKDVVVKYEKALEEPENEDLLVEVLHLLHNCMVSNDCESNISLEEL